MDSIWFKANRSNQLIETYYSLDGETYTHTCRGFLIIEDTVEVEVLALRFSSEEFELLSPIGVNHFRRVHFFVKRYFIFNYSIGLIHKRVSTGLLDLNV